MITHWRRAVQDYLAASQTTGGANAQREIETGTAQLETFMNTLGAEAMELLKASKCFIRLAETPAGDGGCAVYVLDGEGLRVSQEAAGMWVAYTKNVPVPVMAPITARQAIEAAVTYGGKKATEVVDWLHKELDRIAAAAPKSP